MMYCLWCGQEEMTILRLTDILQLSPIKKEALCRKCTSRCSALRDVATCEGCGRRWNKGEVCEDCSRWKELYPDYSFHNEALYEYNEFMKEWMENYKFKGDYRFREIFAAPLKESIEARIKKGWLIVPIPISQKSRATRGFNQVTGMLNFGGVPYTEVLQHVGTGAKQSTKNRKHRMTSLQPFTLLHEYKSQLAKQPILLVDDVYTTGRTLFHAADCLLANGAKEVRTLTLAR